MAAAGRKFRVGYVFQNPDYQLFAEEVWEEVAFGVRLLGLPPGRWSAGLRPP